MPQSSLTSDQARDLVTWAGSVQGAADAIGVPRSTLSYWLNAEYFNAQKRARYAADLERGRAAVRERYHSETGVQYARRLLRMRRNKALTRRAGREQRRASAAL